MHHSHARIHDHFGAVSRQHGALFIGSEEVHHVTITTRKHVARSHWLYTISQPMIMCGIGSLRPGVNVLWCPSTEEACRLSLQALSIEPPH